MLNHLAIKNFTTVDELELDFNAGLTTITGETGAGKSVMLDALSLALGSRSKNNVLRNEARQAEIIACFQLDANCSSKAWLQTQDLLEDNDTEVILRRVIKPDGRSRTYINGSTVKLSDLKALGESLVDLHGQHEHQSLLNKQTHLQLLDNFANSNTLKQQVAASAQQCHTLKSRIDDLRSANASKDARLQLLSYQVQELDQLAPQNNEHHTLEAEQKKLANANELLNNLNTATQLCSNDDAAGSLTLTQQALQLLKKSQAHLPELSNTIELLTSASIQIEEASAELGYIAAQVTLDPERLSAVEERLDAIYSIARKHNIHADELTAHHGALSKELARFKNSDSVIEQLLEEYTALKTGFTQLAKKLSRVRKSTGKKLGKSINQKLADLQMKHCQFEIALQTFTNQEPNIHGLETAEFLIATVPGKPAQALAKIASGGELSRISLAIQVVTAQTSNVPTLVFDEVDVGIGGGVAEVVGNLLRELGSSCQVFCVTHLAQVAAKGAQHLLVSKQVSKSSATTSINLLDKKSRKSELARMISGIDVTDSTMAHAKELLESA